MWPTAKSPMAHHLRNPVLNNLALFFREAIEIQYAKNLASLANSVHAAQEEG